MSLFVELIQVALGTRTVLSRIPSEGDWQQIYETAAKQSLVGVVLHGIEELRAKNAERYRLRLCEADMKLDVGLPPQSNYYGERCRF